MTPATEDPGATRGERLRMGLQLVLGIALVAYGVAQLTDTVTLRPPAVVYFVAGIGLFAYGVYRTRQ